MSTFVTPHTWTVNDDATSTNLQTLTDAILFRQTPPMCNVYQATGTLTTTTTPTAVPFDAEERDTDGFHSTTSNNSRITIPAGLGGRYRLLGQVDFTSSASGGYRRLELRRNGTVVVSSNLPAVVRADHLMQISFDLALAVGDYVELYAANSVGNISTITGSGGTFLHCHWISTA